MFSNVTSILTPGEQFQIRIMPSWIFRKTSVAQVFKEKHIPLRVCFKKIFLTGLQHSENYTIFILRPFIASFQDLKLSIVVVESLNQALISKPVIKAVKLILR